MNELTCKICGYRFPEMNLEESIEAHLQEEHFMGYQDYYELGVLGKPYEDCWKCGNPKHTITPWTNTFFLPCPVCFDPGSKAMTEEVKARTDTFFRELQAKVLKNKFLQYLLSLSPAEREPILDKNFDSFISLMSDLKKQEKVRLDKSHIFHVTNVLGTSPEVSDRNIKNLRMEAEELKMTDLGDRWELGDLGICIKKTEMIGYDARHHNRSSILNPASKRSVKRIRIGAAKECYRLYSPPNQTVKAIYSLQYQGKTVGLRDFSPEIQRKIKFGILKTKELVTPIFDITNEILKYSIRIEDSVILLNSVSFPWTLSTDFTFALSWSWEDFDTRGTEKIKLSIL